jgi:long-subunit acyl-CoA synthetase (AMP-forming)
LCRWAAVDGANARLARVAQIERFAICPSNGWPDSDELSPAMKLKRRPIEQKCAAQIDVLYRRRSPDETRELQPRRRRRGH